MRRLLAIVAAAGLLTTGPAAAESRPERVRLTAESSKGAVLIRVPVQSFEYSLQFSRNGSSGFLSRVYQMNVRAGPAGYRYIARTLAPGRYRLDTVWQQGRWSACLEQGTIEFQVIAGRIAYVGTLQVEPILASVQRQAVARGRTSVAAGDIVMSRADDTPPDGRWPRCRGRRRGAPVRRCFNERQRKPASAGGSERDRLLHFGRGSSHRDLRLTGAQSPNGQVSSSPGFGSGPSGVTASVSSNHTQPSYCSGSIAWA
jgi:hypothetical protein